MFSSTPNHLITDGHPRIMNLHVQARSNSENLTFGIQFRKASKASLFIMTTTVDSEMIGKMIHSDCDRHHCHRGQQSPPTLAKSKTTTTSPPIISTPEVKEQLPPEFLHCGIWPPTSTPPNATERRDAPFEWDVIKKMESLSMSPKHAAPLDADEDSVNSDTGSNTSNGSEVEDSMAITPAPPLPAASCEGLSEAVAFWTISTAGSDDRGRGTGNGKAPYSVLRLFARYKDGDVNGDELQSSTRRILFDQEITAEAQARVEITDYINTLVEDGEYDQGYSCVWPLERYRRDGWTAEMTAAYAPECARFTENVREQSRARGAAEQSQRGEAS